MSATSKTSATGLPAEHNPIAPITDTTIALLKSRIGDETSLNVTVGLYESLKKARLEYVWQIVELDEADLRIPPKQPSQPKPTLTSTQKLGVKKLVELKRALAEEGLHLGMKLPTEVRSRFTGDS